MSTASLPFSADAPAGLLPWLKSCFSARKMRAADWHESFAFSPVHTAQGVIYMAPVYRRSTEDGTYEYRAMTKSEEADYISRDAW